MPTGLSQPSLPGTHRPSRRVQKGSGPKQSLRRRPVIRCAWAQATPELRRYHDREYGFPVARDRAYFERLALEIFQAGLSWRTILAKRSALRRAFSGFWPQRVASFSARDVRRLLADKAIIRNRSKIQAVVTNAGIFRQVARQAGSFRRFLLGLPLQDRGKTTDILRRTFHFMGPKIIAEFLMSTGHWPVRHENGCFLKPVGTALSRGATRGRS